MANRKFQTGTIIKGRELKGMTLCKILSEDMVMRGFQYQIGINEDINQFAGAGPCRRGLYFCLAEDVCRFLGYGTKLAVVSVPDDEDVYVDNGKFRTHRLYIHQVMPLSKTAVWECLVANGVDVTADFNGAVPYAAAMGFLDVVKYLHENGADITAYDNYAVICASANGRLEAVEYLYKNGADITDCKNYAVRYAAAEGHRNIVEYLHKQGADITACEGFAVQRALEHGHTDVVQYLKQNGVVCERFEEAGGDSERIK